MQQPPQLAASTFGLTHWPAHQVSPCEQTQEPFWQLERLTRRGRGLRPQAPGRHGMPCLGGIVRCSWRPRCKACRTTQ
jgi:hypothetical protein